MGNDIKIWYCYFGIEIAGAGPKDNKPFECEGTEAQASVEAWRAAIEELDSWGGLHGLPDSSKFEDYGEFEEEAEGWIDYYIKLKTPELEREIEENWS